MAESIAAALIRNYALSNRQAFTARARPLRKGEYMMQAFPGRYKNEQSAYQAYNQTIKGKRPGKRLENAAEPDRTMELRGKRVSRGDYRVGLWKVVVHYSYVDEDGNTVEGEEASFNAESMEHENLLAVPYLKEALFPVAEEYLANRVGKRYEQAEIDYIEVLPINTYRVTAVDLDRLYI